MRFFRDDESLAAEVADFIATGIELGDQCLCFVEEHHEDGIKRELHARNRLDLKGKVEFYNAVQAAEKLCAGGDADPAVFNELVAPRVESAIRRSKTGRARVFGEIVSVLWRSGQEKQAAKAETFWNDLGLRLNITLYCGYRLDMLECRCDLWEIAESHQTVLADGKMMEFDQSIEKALDHVLGSQAKMVRARIAQESRLRGMPYSQAALIWLDRHMPLTVPEVLRVARAPDSLVEHRRR